MFDKYLAAAKDAGCYAVREIEEIVNTSGMCNDKLCNLMKAMDIIDHVVDVHINIIEHYEMLTQVPEYRHKQRVVPVAVTYVDSCTPEPAPVRKRMCVATEHPTQMAADTHGVAESVPTMYLKTEPVTNGATF